MDWDDPYYYGQGKPTKAKPIQPREHHFRPTGVAKAGKAWGTTATETKCMTCGAVYWVGVDEKPDEECLV